MITSQPAPTSPARDRGFHPLELIPLFRRWPPSLPRDLLYTAIWSSLLGLGLAVIQNQLGRSSLPFDRLLFNILVISNLIGFMIHGMMGLLDRFYPPAPQWRLRTAQLLSIALASAIGIPVGKALLAGRSPLRFVQYAGPLALLLAFALVTAVLMVMVLAAGERRQRQAAEMAGQQERAAAAGRLVAEARLSALQAQIEPHFLYNTLANVVSLIEHHPAQARRMLERFIDYLRAGLAASRSERASLGSELDLAGAYLEVLGVRLGARLRWRIEADPGLRPMPMPPMLLQPLVENAIMHGIEPKLEGGEIVLRAGIDGDALCIEVADSGRGLVPAPPRPGGGVGLTNLRERLRRLNGQLQLIENPAGGVTSRLLLPATTVTSSTTPAP